MTQEAELPPVSGAEEGDVQAGGVLQGHPAAAVRGRVPVARSTGGLKDSIIDCGDGHSGNGFVFGGVNAGELIYAVQRAVGLYYVYGDIWKELRQRTVECDFSWNNSAKAYQAFYDEMF